MQKYQIILKPDVSMLLDSSTEECQFSIEQPHNVDIMLIDSDRAKSTKYSKDYFETSSLDVV